MSLHIGASAAAIASIRTHTAKRTGCPEWQTPGIVSALEATQGAPGDVLAAAALAAGDPKLRLPSAAGFAHHWPVNASALAPVSHNVACVDHPQHDMPCPHRDHGGDMTPEQIAEAARAIRAALPRLSVPTRTPPAGDAPRPTRRAQREEETP